MEKEKKEKWDEGEEKEREEKTKEEEKGEEEEQKKRIKEKTNIKKLQTRARPSFADLNTHQLQQPEESRRDREVPRGAEAAGAPQSGRAARGLALAPVALLIVIFAGLLVEDPSRGRPEPQLGSRARPLVQAGGRTQVGRRSYGRGAVHAHTLVHTAGTPRPAAHAAVGGRGSDAAALAVQAHALIRGGRGGEARQPRSGGGRGVALAPPCGRRPGAVGRVARKDHVGAVHVLLVGFGFGMHVGHLPSFTSPLSRAPPAHGPRGQREGPSERVLEGEHVVVATVRSLGDWPLVTAYSCRLILDPLLGMRGCGWRFVFCREASALLAGGLSGHRAPSSHPALALERGRCAAEARRGFPEGAHWQCLRPSQDTRLPYVINDDHILISASGGVGRTQRLSVWVAAGASGGGGRRECGGQQVAAMRLWRRASQGSSPGQTRAGEWHGGRALDAPRVLLVQGALARAGPPPRRLPSRAPRRLTHAAQQLHRVALLGSHETLKPRLGPCNVHCLRANRSTFRVKYPENKTGKFIIKLPITSELLAGRLQHLQRPGNVEQHLACIFSVGTPVRLWSRSYTNTSGL